MAKKEFVELHQHLGAIKSRWSQNSPFVYGLIIGVSEDAEHLTKDTVVRFRIEGDVKIKELRIAAFERASELIADISKQQLDHQQTQVVEKPSRRDVAEYKLLQFLQKYYPPLESTVAA